jgi:transposase-like protein
MARLEQVVGPECPLCGCKESTIRKRTQRWNGKRIDTTHRCANCKNDWIQTDDGPAAESKTSTAVGRNGQNALASTAEPALTTRGDAVIYGHTRCPACGSTKTRVGTTQRPVRYHKCVDCRHTFKSIEL